MAFPVARAISKIYLVLALLTAILLSPLPYSVIALALFVLQVYSVYKPFRTDLNLAFTFSILLLLPITLEPSAVGVFSALLVIPAIPLLDYDIRENALHEEFVQSEGRKATTTLKTLAAALLVALAISLILANWALTFTSVLLAAYLVGIVAYIFYGIPGIPLQASAARVRVIAGNTAEASVTIRSRAKMPLHAQVTSSYPWVSLNPAKFSLGGDEAVLNIALTPPLSGPSRPQLQALMIDPWGLIRIKQNLQPVELNVIPRARYAEWLAKQFLEQAALEGTLMPVALSSATVRRASGRGVEYMTSRPYQPGDKLKDMDWKHMCKLNQFIVKEYGETQHVATIVAANLTVKDPEEADNLAYNLITSVLTLAGVNAPTALAVYNHREVLLTTKAIDPREILKVTLKVAQNITVAEQEQRFLQPPEIRRLKTNIAQLQQAGTESAQKLAELLRLEDEALQQVAKDHPAAIAITRTAECIRPPAIVTVISGWNHDTEALVVTLDRLERRGYNIVSVGASRAATLVGVAK